MSPRKETRSDHIVGRTNVVVESYAKIGNSYILLPNSMQYFSTLPLLYRLYQHCMVKFFHCMVKFFHCMVKFFHCMVIYLNSLQILREILCITTSDAFALQIMLFNKSCCILEALFISAQHFLSFVVF